MTGPRPAPAAPPDPMAPLALICSVELESAPVRARLRDVRDLEIGRRRAAAGSFAGTPLLVVEGGMGKTNAAQTTAALLERHAVRGVVGFGVGGAFTGAGLELGDVALASEEAYADEGVLTPAGWLSTEAIGIPLLADGPDGAAYNTFALDAARVATAARALERGGVRFRCGRFVTVSTCSGTAARGAELADRFGAICESMEGAAVAHVCALYRVPFIEVRGISNHVVDRDLSGWRLADAAAAAADAALLVAAAWPAAPNANPTPSDA